MIHKGSTGKGVDTSIPSITSQDDPMKSSLLKSSAASVSAPAIPQIDYKLRERPSGYEISAIDRARGGNFVVGHIFVLPDDETPGTVYVENVEVEPEYRRQGIGLALYRKMIELVKNLGYRAFRQGEPRSSEAEGVWSKLRNLYPVSTGVQGDQIQLKTSVSKSAQLGGPWYHGTSRANLTSIKEAGELLPGKDSSYSGDLEPRPDAVYITNSLQIALGYAKDHGDGAVVEVEVEDTQFLLPDEDAIKEALVKGHIVGSSDAASLEVVQEIESFWLNWYNSEDKLPDADESEDFEYAWAEFEPELTGTRAAKFNRELSERIKHQQPDLAQRIIEVSHRAAHLGALRVLRVVETVSKTAQEEFTEEGHWAGEGNAASGVLPIARDTKLICLAWRSSEVHMGDCWGTIGGAVQTGRTPEQSAKVELQEETGYKGDVELHPAFVFQDGSFSYHNFIGVVSSEFTLRPGEDHGWETDFIEWFTLEQVEEMLKEEPDTFHPGMIQLFQNSKQLIERLADSADVKTKQATDRSPITDTPQFKAWFGNSKIVDEHGQPKIMYHASTADFDTFQPNARGVFFFSPSPKWVDKFTSNDSGEIHEGANVKAAYIAASNPFDYEDARSVRALSSAASLGDLAIKQIRRGDWSRLEDRTTLAAIKSLGFDGLYVKEDGVKNLAVFNPGQIKSATSNNGSFDPTDHRITAAKEGGADTDGESKISANLPPAPSDFPEFVADVVDHVSHHDLYRILHIIKGRGQLTAELLANLEPEMRKLQAENPERAAYIYYQLRHLELPRKGEKAACLKTASLTELEDLKSSLTLSTRDQHIVFAEHFPDEWYEGHEHDAADATDADLNEFWELNHRVMEHDRPDECPAFMFLEYKETSKGWVAHFTDHAAAIEKEGFTKGVSDVNRLALTSHMEDDEKLGGGYAFGFPTKTSKDREFLDNIQHQPGYGGQVVFTYVDYVLCHHYGDRYDQAIFWGDDAKRRISVIPNGLSWQVNGYGRVEALSDVVHLLNIETPTQEPASKEAGASKPLHLIPRKEYVDGKENRLTLAFYQKLKKTPRMGEVGLVGDFLEGEALRNLYSCALNVPIYSLDHAVVKGEKADREDTIFHGAFGSLKGRPAIFMNPNGRDQLTTFLEEAAHACRASKGRKDDPQNYLTMTQEEHDNLPSEQSAAKMVAHAMELMKEDRNWDHTSAVFMAVDRGDAPYQGWEEDYPHIKNYQDSQAAPKPAAKEHVTASAASSKLLPFDEFTKLGFSFLPMSLLVPEIHSIEEAIKYLRLRPQKSNKANLKEIYDFAKQRYDVVVQWFDNLPDQLTLYRAIQVSDVEGVRPGGLGVYWTTDEATAIAHWGKGVHPIRVFRAVVSKSDIDVEQTIRARMMMPTGNREKEIRLKQGTVLRNLAVRDEGGEFAELPELEGKTASTSPNENLSISDVIADSGVDIFLKDDKGKTQGFLITINADGWLRPRTAFVDPSYRNQGWGKAMYQHLLRVAKQKGLKGIMAGWETSEDADRVWKSLGAERDPDTGAFFKRAAKTPEQVYEGLDLLTSEFSDLPPLNELLDDIPSYDRKSKNRAVLQHLYDQIAELHDSNKPIDVYRAIALKGGPEAVNKQNFGVYWSWDESAAKAYYPEDSNAPVYVFAGKVSKEQVDWWETAKRNLCNDEKEIRLLEGAPVELLAWRPIEDPQWKGFLPEPMRVTASGESKLASPDFGYSQYNEKKEKSLKKLRIVDTPLGDHLLEVMALKPGQPNFTSDPEGFITAEYFYLYGKYEDAAFCITRSDIKPKWRGSGLGQMLYDKLIEVARSRGAKYLYSDDIRSADAESAWKRLSKRYPVEVVADLDRYRVDLSTRASKAAGLPKNPPGKAEDTVYEPETNGWSLFPDQRGDNETVPIEKLLPADTFQKHALDHTQEVTENPKFMAWFGDSKVVDPQGRPLKMYHGTKAVFDTFDLGKFGKTDAGWMGKGFYFTYNPEEASGYALSEVFGEGESPNVMPVYLSIKNPFVITLGVLPDGRNLRDLHEGHGINSKGSGAVRELAEQGGHDGILLVNKEGMPLHAVAFRPDQIKSALGNSGDFKLEDQRITAKLLTEKQAALPPVEEDKALINEFLEKLRNALLRADATTVETKGADPGVMDGFLNLCISDASSNTIRAVTKGEHLDDYFDFTTAAYINGGHYEPNSGMIQVNLRPGVGEKVWAAAKAYKHDHSAWDSFAHKFSALLVHERTHLHQFRAAARDAEARNRSREVAPGRVLQNYSRPIKTPEGFIVSKSMKAYLSHQLEIGAHARQAVEQLRNAQHSWGSYDNKSIYTLLQNSGLWGTLSRSSTAFDRYYTFFYIGANRKTPEERRNDAAVFRRFIQACIKALPPEDHKPMSKEDYELFKELDPPKFKADEEPAAKKSKLLKANAAGVPRSFTDLKIHIIPGKFDSYQACAFEPGDYDPEDPDPSKAIGYVECWDDGKGAMWVDDSFVDPSWRGTGLGQHLYDLVIAEARRKGYKQFRSGKVLTEDGARAWQRLGKRYPVQEFPGEEEGTDTIFAIDLSKVKTASPDPAHTNFGEFQLTLKYLRSQYVGDGEPYAVSVSAEIDQKRVAKAVFLIADVHEDGGFTSLPDLVPSSVHVQAPYRRQGLATAMYQFAESQTGRKIRHQPANQNDDARALWGQKDRRFGNQADGIITTAPARTSPQHP